MIRADIAELLRAGLSNRAVAHQAQTHRSKVQAAREELGIPRLPPGRPAASSPEDLFWRRAIPTDDGHLLWPGADPRTGSRIHHVDGRFSVHKVAFRIRWGRDPVGKVTTGCDHQGCIHPRCVEDQPMRDTYRAVFGAVAP